MTVFLLSLVVFAVETVQGFRHCQFTPDGDRWRVRQQQRLGYDPCDESATQSWLYRMVPIALALSSVVTLGAGIGVAVLGRRNDERGVTQA
jgi:hypothetical protein